MSRAEEKSLEMYPRQSVLILPARRGGYYADKHLRDGFIQGYEQAEKDLALTWEDIKLICEIEDRYWNEEFDENSKRTTQEYYEEVLRRFLESKNQ